MFYTERSANQRAKENMCVCVSNIVMQANSKQTTTANKKRERLYQTERKN